MFNAAYYKKLIQQVKSLVPKINESAFLKDALKNLDTLALNERLRHTSLLLKTHLPGSFSGQLEILYKLAPLMPRGYTALVYPYFVAQFGLKTPKLSLPALKFFTAFGSSEFAIRHFLREDFKTTLAVMEKWSRDKDVHARRLASEGSRPRLPWSFKLDAVLENPSSTALILDNLKQDAELYVRKSVANHLNDLSKDHTEYMLSVFGKWDLEQAYTAWIVKHAARTLVKKGDQRVLRILKFDEAPEVSVTDFKISKKIKLGERLSFSFSVLSLKNKMQRLVIDYRVHYLKASGKDSAKVFKLKNLNLPPHSVIKIALEQVIKDFSTRTHHAGKHKVEILVNGMVMASGQFMLEK